MITTVLGTVAALATLVLPGCWFTFLPWARQATAGARFSIALVLTPSVVALQFYLLRWLGFSFDTTTILIPIVNLPVLAFIIAGIRQQPLPDRRSLLLRACVLAIPMLYVASWLYDPQVAANRGHAWLHTDIIYMIANGQLRPEEPQLAGIALAYPWTAHISEAVVARLTGLIPGVAYMLSHAAILIGIVGLVAAIVDDLGGSRFAREMSAVLVCFGVNWLGPVAAQFAPASLVRTYPVFGDDRYMPWIRKFRAFEPTVFGIGLCAALIYLVSRDWPEGRRAGPLILSAILLVALGTTYPVLFPAGLAVVLVRGVVYTGELVRRRERSLVPQLAGLAVIAIAGAAATAAYTEFVTVARASVPAVSLTPTAWQAKMKLARMGLAFLPFLALASPVLPGLLRRHWRQVSILFGAWFACIVLHVMFVIHHVHNEYKYVFPATVALAPFAALALGALYARHRRTGLAVGLLVIPILMAPAIQRRMGVTLVPQSIRPALLIRDFDVRLAARESLAPLVEAVRAQSPRSAVLVTNGSRLDLVTLTRRSLFVLPDSPVVHAMGMGPDALLKQVRSYDPDIVDRRRAAANALYTGEDRGRTAALAEMMGEVDRPLVLVLELPRDAALAAWLAGGPRATRLFAGQHHEAWLADIRP